MIEINGRKFAKNDSEFIDTLFDKNGTANGFYKKLKRRVLFLDMQKNPFACLVHNRHKEKFFVSCSIQNGKLWYMHALTSKDEKLLGLDTVTFSEQAKTAQSLI